MATNSANIDEAPLCNICHHPVSRKENSISCSGLCGKWQHISCLIFSYDDDDNNIIWKCNNCLIKVENDLHVAGGLSEESQEPVGNCNFILEENTQLFDYEANNFPIKSSPQLEAGAFNNCFPEKTDSEIVISAKNISDGNIILNEKCKERERTDQSYPSPKKRKLSDNIMQPSKELGSVNDDYIIIENMTKQKRPKLFDHLGYSYTIRRQNFENTEWKCASHNRNRYCKAIIIQSNNCFIAKRKHNHTGNWKLYTSAKKNKEQNSSQKTTLFSFSETNNNLEENLPTEKEVGRIPGEDDILFQKISKEHKGRTLKENVFHNYNCASKAEGGVRVNLLQLSKLDKVKKRKEYLPKTVQIKQKSVYILLDDGNNLSSKLFDQTLGYTYNLYKVTNKTKIFMCAKSNPTQKCEAYVKQVGNLFVRSGKKHNHKNRKCLSFDQKQNKRNNLTDTVRILSLPLNTGPAYENLEQDSIKSVTQYNLESEETSTPYNASRICKLRKRKVSVKISKPQFCVIDISRISKNVKFPQENDVNESLLKENDIDKILLNILDSLHYAGVYLTNNVIMENVRNYVNENAIDININRGWVFKFYKKYEKQIGDKYILKSAYKDLLSLLPGRVKSLFTDLERLLNVHDLNVEEMLSICNSDRIYNCDIMEVMVNNNYSNISRVKNKSRETFSIQCCVSASGKSTKPVIINNGEKVFTYKTTKEFEGDYNCMCSSTGEFTDSMFITWLSQDFIHFLIKNNIKTPVLLLVNGTRISISWNCLNFANKNGIILFQLPLFDRSCQPLTCGILQAVRKQYRVLEQNFDCNSTKLCKVFPTLFMKALNNVDIKQCCQESFEATGICPLDIKKLTSTSAQKVSLALSKCERTLIVDPLSITSDEVDVQESLFNSNDYTNLSSSDKAKVNNDDSMVSSTISQTDLRSHPVRPEKYDDFNLSPHKSLAHVRKLGIDKFSLKLGYKLALSNVEKICESVLEPVTLEMFQKKLEGNEELCDSNFAIWQGLQQLKEVPELFEKIFEG